MTNDKSINSIDAQSLPNYCQFYNVQFNQMVRNKLNKMRKSALKSQLIEANELFNVELNYVLNKKKSIENCTVKKWNWKPNRCTATLFATTTTVCVILIAALTFNIETLLGIRCILPNNYLIWEATRPISDCRFCAGITSPLVLFNVTQEKFASYAYQSQPIIIKNAADHWPAKKQLTFHYLKNLYQKYPNELKQFDNECQFLPFKSSFGSLREFFEMPDEQIENGTPPWYIGFSNCQLNILAELRKLYPKPHFLPEDAEIPNTDYIFLGYEEGAVMHLDYIPRMMWQAQLQGTKYWKVSPTPECDTRCSNFEFYVEPGDAVLLDTRIWYHGTFVKPGQFSMTIQSEYG